MKGRMLYSREKAILDLQRATAALSQLDDSHSHVPPTCSAKTAKGDAEA